MRDKFGRDPGIREIIEFYDLPEHCRWDLLTDREAKVLHEEIARCADPEDGYRYIARNYYWITTKDGSDTLLQFKDTQEMVWDTIKMLRRRGRGVKLLIIKARQLFISSFCDGLLAYETQFRPGNRGLLVSYDEDHAAKLFGMILHIYDQLPWWLRPMIGARKYEEGIHLINPEPEMRRHNPGLNSRITVQGATQNVGVAEGQTINTAHLTEFGSWSPHKARKVIVGDFRWALPDHASTTAILETRVQKASRFAERLWETQVELGDDADWYPLFIPIYFDRSHFLPPRKGWQPAEPELAVKRRAAEEWCQCTGCRQLRPAAFGGGEDRACRDCGRGEYVPYVLQDGQMRWLEHTRLNAEGIGQTAVVEMQQSLATNPQEAFASVTETVFSKPAMDWVAASVSSAWLARGFMASDGVFHAPRFQRGEESAQCRAPDCKVDHRGEANRLLKIWLPPERGVRYAMGVDPSAGYGGARDYAAIIVLRLGQGPQPDVQAAAYRSNTLDAWHLADLANFIGRWYNNALAVVDYTNYQTTGDRLLQHWRYPNIYQWKLPEAVRQTTNRWHWVWNNKNKESAWQVVDGRLRDHSLVVKDPILAKELRHYQRLSDGSLGAPDSKDDDGLGDEMEKIHDDCCTCLIQTVVAADQQNPRRALAAEVAEAPHGLRKGQGEWQGTCGKCTRTFPAQAPCERDRCPYCRSFLLRWRMVKEDKPTLGFEWADMAGVSARTRDRHGAPEEMSFGFYGGMNDGQIGF
jgi:hypothetical protein